MVELRKRKAAPEPATALPQKKKSDSTQKSVSKPIVASDAGEKQSDKAQNGVAELAVGEGVPPAMLDIEVETHAGEAVTLKKMLADSSAGVVLFTYPKASTPGCTTQACLFRDNYSTLTSSGISVYGLSADSPKSNTTFATKQSLPYPLLCDPPAALISAIGMKKGSKGTTRGVIAIDKDSKVTAWEQAGPQRTLDAVLAVLSKHTQVTSSGQDNNKASEDTKDPGPPRSTSEQVETADTAAQVADSAEKLDKNVEIGPSA